MADSPWSIDGQRASLAISNIQARLDLSRPDLGLRIHSWRGVALDSLAILGVVFPDAASGSAPFDAYARGADMIVTYAEREIRPFRVQAYWRFVANVFDDEVEAFAVDLQLSVQTPLWDCAPVVHTRTQLGRVDSLQQARLALAMLEADDASAEPVLNAAGEVFSAAVSDRAPGVQYVEMIHAQDLQSNRVEMIADGWQLEHDLFEPGLEKGVIRRVRVRGILYAGAADDERVERAYRAFHHAPLPLTT